LQDNDIKGWINKIMILNIMKYKNYELGQTIKISAHRHELVFSNTEMKGYSGAEYPAFRGFLNVGDIHSCEPWLYSECLKKNIALRVREWRKKNKE
jgi:hypothetical protein